MNICNGANTDSILSLCRSTSLCILHIETVDSVMPTCELIGNPPEGCVGHGIKNNEKVGARMWIEQDCDTIYDSGEYIENVSGLTIKVRGNTTASINNADKKPYKIKLQKKMDLLFRGADEKYADKDWVLLRHVICETLAGNMTNRALQMPWTPAEKVVLLLLNGDFRGLYLLIESVKRNQKCRVDVSKEGFIYEYDAYWWNEDYYIQSDVYSPFACNYTLKYPKTEDILPWQEQYLVANIRQVENAYMASENIDQYIDVSSYARWLWVHDMLGDWDYGGSNPFIAKFDTFPTSKTFMTCAWDFGGCFTDKRKGQWGRQHTFWCYDYFFKKPQPSFIKEYISMYDNIINKAFEIVAEELDSLSMTQLAEQMNYAQLLDNERWNITEDIPSNQLQVLADYLRNRKYDIDSLMNIMKNDNQSLLDNKNEVVDDLKYIKVLKGKTFMIMTPHGFYNALGQKIKE